MKKHIRSLIFSDRMTIFSPVDIEVTPQIGGKLRQISKKNKYEQCAYKASVILK